MAVRASTTTAGGRSRTATLISRYGRPHTTDIRTNRAAPRLVTVRTLALEDGIRWGTSRRCAA